MFGGAGGRRRGEVAAVVLAVLTCVLIGSPAAMAIEFTVNSTADDVDAVPGNESCATAGGVCTLRAAIEEGNSVGEFTRIDFDEELFDGQVIDTIALGSSLPTIAVSAFVNGRTCETEAEVVGPCVGIAGPGGGSALVLANEVEVRGLAITGAATAVRLEAAPRAKVRASWLGVALDGAVAGNGTGVFVGPGSNRSSIGGEGPDHGNVIAGSSNDGLDVHGGNEVKVHGNYFGVEPDGVTPAPNGGDAVEVASTEGLEVTGTEIGTRVSAAAAASQLCDRGCNVISAAGSHGIDLEGEGESEAPAVSTLVAGNYIGLDATGTAAVPSSGAGVRVGEAAHTIIGGPSAAEANRINGGSAAVLAGPAAPDLSVRGNLIGTDSTGAAPLAPPDDGIVVDSAELPSSLVEAEIVGNVIGMEDGVAIAQRGQGAWIFANEIIGAQVGIRTFESSVAHGNVIEGNLIEGPAVNGILLETDLNEVVGNEILGAGAAGIRVHGSSLPFGVTGNRVGGDTPGDENFIVDSGGAAIEIANLEATDNEVARNSGAGNAGSFIDLIAASPDTEVGPNRGIEPPTLSTATQTGASGGAEPGSRVRVFRKQAAAAGELDSFLGEAVADGGGGWEVTYEAAVPVGAIVAATQTKEGATSELAIVGAGVVVGDGGCAFIGGPGCAGSGVGAGGDSAGPSDGPLAQRQRPQTKIVRARARGHTARFVFRSDQVGASFLCKLDDRPFDLCRSPKRYVGLRPGRHVFWVRAVDPLGRVDLSPARRKLALAG